MVTCWRDAMVSQSDHIRSRGHWSGRCQIWLLLGWVSVCGQVNHLDIYNQHQGQLSLTSF